MDWLKDNCLIITIIGLVLVIILKQTVLRRPPLTIAGTMQYLQEPVQVIEHLFTDEFTEKCWFQGSRLSLMYYKSETKEHVFETVSIDVIGHLNGFVINFQDGTISRLKNTGGINSKQGNDDESIYSLINMVRNLVVEENRKLKS